MILHFYSILAYRNPSESSFLHGFQGLALIIRGDHVAELSEINR